MNEAALLQSVLDCLAANYGLSGALARLPGENLNFLLVTSQGGRQVVKIVDEHIPAAVVEMESAAMKHAERGGFPFRLPKIVENIYGNIETYIFLHINEPYRLILMDFIDGSPMSSLSDISESLLFDLGNCIATFDRIVQDFDHPAARRDHRWNLANAQQHERKDALVRDPENRALLQWAFGLWREARRALSDLPWQFIHGDAHDENVLVEGGGIVGLIDFGDCCYNPAVCELATCLTYLMMRGDNPGSAARTVMEGYRAARPLAPLEVGMLYPLVCARLAVSVSVANERKAIDPDNPNWFGSEASAWRLLRYLQRSGASVLVHDSRN